MSVPIGALVVYLLVIVLSYLVGAIPFSYYLAKAVSGKDLTRIGTGNIGAMNVRRATDSWAWFFAAMVLDGVKGFVPVFAARYLSLYTAADPTVCAGLALVLAVAGHNYSILAYRITGKLASGRGLATGGGALLAYNWIYLVGCLAFALPVIFVSGYLLLAQVTVPFFLIAMVLYINPADLPYVVAVAALVVIRHAERFVAMLSGKEPRWNIRDYKQVRDE